METEPFRNKIKGRKKPRLEAQKSITFNGKNCWIRKKEEKKERNQGNRGQRDT